MRTCCDAGILDCVVRYARGDAKGMKKNQCWEWEFFGSPLGPSIISIAEIGGKIISHFAGIPIPFKYFNRRISCVKAEASFVDKHCRSLSFLKQNPHLKGRRVFQETVEDLIKQAKGQKFSLIFGYPNAEALPAQVKAGFKYVGFNRVVAMRIFNGHAFLSKTNLFHDRYFCDAYDDFREWYIWAINYFKANKFEFIDYLKAVEIEKRISGNKNGNVGVD